METLILTPYKRKAAFIRLGEFMKNPDESLKNTINDSQNSNGWFTPEEVSRAISDVSKMLKEDALNEWFNSFQHRLQMVPGKQIGLILAGNIPMVGFHDILCVLASGHTALIKLSSQDKNLIPYLLEKLKEFEPGFSEQYKFVEKLDHYDAVIATGSNNSSRYFDHYFGKVPHIIRKNRNSIAVFSGDETSEQLHALGSDIFSFYGLGCRNVSKIFVPEGYNFNHFFESIQPFETTGDHHKYNNNYDYNKSIYLVNRTAHLDNGFLILKEDESLTSPLAVLYYEEYNGLQSLEQKLESISDRLQCIVTSEKLNTAVQKVDFGRSQEPELWDYADGINTMDFLLNL